MKNNRVSFGILRQVLLGLGFRETTCQIKEPLPSLQMVYKHPESGVLLALPKQRLSNRVHPMLVAGVRRQLIDHGLVEEDAFEDLLNGQSAKPSPRHAS